MTSEAQQARSLALVLKAIADLEREKVAWNLDWKSRMEELINSRNAIGYEILSGQERLPLEAPELKIVGVPV